MTLNDREKKIALGTGIVLGAIVFYQLILGPLIESRAQAFDRLDKAKADLATDHQTMSSSRRLAAEFVKMSGPSMKHDAPEAEGQVLNAISEWARECNLALGSVKTEPGEKEKGFQKVTFRAT
ncbi:MAG TPA: type II secretion system protein GspM, partial [Tepidisphaeraceae bacterium]|nr:type II secretion system protein GspM [Tepidisphaeraceae bacterium]